MSAELGEGRSPVVVILRAEFALRLCSRHECFHGYPRGRRRLRRFYQDRLCELASGDRLSARFEELDNLFVLLRSEIGANTHVHHHDFPLRRAVVARRSDVVTTHAILRPELRAAFLCR